MIRSSALLMFAVSISACTSAASQTGDSTGSGGDASGTVVTGTMTFSPVTDKLTKFTQANVTSMDQAAPPLEVLHESTIGTGNCSMLVLAPGDHFGASGWVFAAPSGKRFAHVRLTWEVYVDPRADFTAEARALLLTPDNEVDLSLVNATDTETASQADIDDAVSGLNQFAVVFSLYNPSYTSSLSRIFTQALRQCPGQRSPFVITATYE